MPSVTLHMHLAGQVLEAWQAAPSSAPFPPRHPRFVNAFRQGAFGPDLGYLPGGPRVLSDLAHCVRSGDLTRTLVVSARTPLERAFAWGWVTHVLADRMIHPWVGRAVGEVLTGRRTFVDGNQAQATHVRVETGLDAHYARLHPELSGLRMDPVFDARSILYMTRAYRDTYGLGVAPGVLLSAHRATVRMSAQGLALTGLMARMWVPRPASWASGALRWGIEGLREIMEGRFGIRPLALAYLSPIPPARWFVAGVEGIARRFSRQVLAQQHAGIGTLGNFNLDTGEPDSRAAHHAGARRALEVLLKAAPPRPVPAGDVASADPLPGASHLIGGTGDRGAAGRLASPQGGGFRYRPGHDRVAST